MDEVALTFSVTVRLPSDQVRTIVTRHLEVDLQDSVLLSAVSLLSLLSLLLCHF